MDGISGGGTGRNKYQWVGENRETAVSGDSKTLEVRLKGLGGYKQEGNRVLAEFGCEFQMGAGKQSESIDEK